MFLKMNVLLFFTTIVRIAMRRTQSLAERRYETHASLSSFMRVSSRPRLSPKRERARSKVLRNSRKAVLSPFKKNRLGFSHFL